MKTALLLPDIHAPYHREEEIDLALSYGKELKPDRVILTGDFADLYTISFWKKDPTRMRFPEEIEEAREILSWITRQFPKAEKIFLEGNHEQRMEHFLMTEARALYGLPELTVPAILKLKEMGWKYINNRKLLNSNKKPFRLGKLYVLHGHEVRASMAAVNIPRIYYFKIHANAVISHHHQTQEYIVKKLDHSHEGCWTMGCLCELSPDFMPVTNWNFGFGVVRYDSSGDFSLENKKIINGKIL